ncbi:efflux RND transporter periplasmic adaptor subunit [Legionella oakridgensis]|uniref:RND family efflux transporter, MFP subunit n=2 Tax=Legionella oakridgensis TaxID=29423 RepID=W0BEL6_9GAMM|nr:efflux RND transporter periplasmic adaptor subunit [Legionella oakridgensis]AHE66849.1 RND family efflux transporter, MFP subunit [Legionella oakridgensis ATCC 33761 = DSM 21215]ETO93474.1 RND family efflux transporter, MFP subunit [Legionella oakridgensis RV-2-2007]KTD39850.1 chemiosmotic efflux system B protein B [Legionella oakridgensis]STY19960.1 Chemiosmotic efflux system B protein B [Legionella longbeachae]
MNYQLIIKSFLIMSLLSLMPLIHAQNTTAGHDKMDMKQPTQNNEIVIDPVRLQAIGITSEPVRRQMVEKTIRTVGRVEADERRVAHIHVRFDGWIEKLFINFTGEQVKAGQALFTVYSPELVATQQEYLLAFNAQKILSKNTTSSAARGALGAFQAAHQRLLLWGITEEDIEQLKRTGKITRTMTIHSPIQGTVLKKMALIGMRIEPGDELYTIADLSRLWVLGDIYEYELPYIKLGQMADLTLSYLPNELFKAKLDFIYPIIDMKTRTAKVRFEVDNQKEQLKPGMYVNLELKIPLGERLVVPKNAVLLTGERAVVFIYHGNGKIEWRDVTLGVRAGDLLEILQGVKEGDNIITSANFLIDSESQLKAAMGGMRH